MTLLQKNLHYYSHFFSLSSVVQLFVTRIYAASASHHINTLQREYCMYCTYCTYTAYPWSLFIIHTSWNPQSLFIIHTCFPALRSSTYSTVFIFNVCICTCTVLLLHTSSWLSSHIRYICTLRVFIVHIQFSFFCILTRA